jgi:hypothetical protein
MWATVRVPQRRTLSLIRLSKCRVGRSLSHWRVNVESWDRAWPGWRVQSGDKPHWLGLVTGDLIGMIVKEVSEKAN